MNRLDEIKKLAETSKKATKNWQDRTSNLGSERDLMRIDFNAFASEITPQLIIDLIEDHGRILYQLEEYMKDMPEGEVAETIDQSNDLWSITADLCSSGEKP